MCVSSTPTRPYVLEVTIKRVPGGLVSNWLGDNLKIGDLLDITGPKGKFCLVPGRVPKKLLFLAAGELPPRTNLRTILATGADLVAFSGGKAIRGPQATGILCGRRDLVGAAAVQMLDMDDHYELWEPPAD